MNQKGWKLLFEDKEILVVVKEPGVATQSGNIQRADLVSLLCNYRGLKGEKPEVFLVHRLDQPVGGILVFGKTKKAAAVLSSQVQNHKMEKYYKAVVEGEIEKEGRLEDYLLQDRKKSIAVVVEKGNGPANPEEKKAELEFKRLAVRQEIPYRSLIEVKLQTGRFHQIRAQMANYGFPICGDRKYQAKSTEYAFPALFAWKLVFIHPGTGEKMEFSEEPDYGYFSEFGTGTV